MRADVAGVAALGAGAALAFPWAAAIASWLANPSLFPSTDVEGLVFSLVLARVLVYFASARIRRESAARLIIFFSGDIVILPLCSVATLLTGDPSFVESAGTYILAWFPSCFLLLPSVLAFRAVSSMAAGSRLAVVLSGAAASFEGSTLALTALSDGAAGGGFPGIARQTLTGFRTQIQAGGDVGSIVLACGGVLLASLVPFAVASGAGRGRSTLPPLALGGAGLVVLAAWVLATSSYPPWVSLGVPTAAATGGVWVLSRGE